MNWLVRIALVAIAFVPIAAHALQPQSTAFTYQGRLAQNGTPTSGTHDLKFALYDAASGGSQVGSTITQNAYPVSNGLFTIDLDFGPGAFTGGQMYLDVSVDGTKLTPRQPVNAVPVAAFALKAASLQNTTVTSSTTFFQNDHLYAGVAVTGSGVPMVMATATPALSPAGTTSETAYPGWVDVYSLTSAITQNGSAAGTQPKEADFRVLARMDPSYIAFTSALLTATVFTKLQIDVLQGVNGAVVQSYCYGTVLITGMQPMPQDNVYEMTFLAGTALYRMGASQTGWNFISNSNSPGSCIQ